jgi:type II secretory pathway pseudopilin PulG
MHSARPPHRRPAFTLVEAMIAVSLAAVAGSVLLLGTASSQQAVGDTLRRTIAAGLAEQLMDEVLGQRYCAPGTDGYPTSLGPNSWEAAGVGRQRYNDIDDYHNVRTTPPKDLWGIELGKDNGQGGTRPAAFQAPGNLMANWRQEIDVYYVSASNLNTKLSSGQVSDYRVVEVRITEYVPNVGWKQWARLRRVVAYEPLLP